MKIETIDLSTVRNVNVREQCDDLELLGDSLL